MVNKITILLILSIIIIIFISSIKVYAAEDLLTNEYPGNNGKFYIKNITNGKFLDLQSGNYGTSTYTIEADFHGGCSQQWEFESVISNVYKIYSVGGKKEQINLGFSNLRYSGFYLSTSQTEWHINKLATNIYNFYKVNTTNGASNSVCS